MTDHDSNQSLVSFLPTLAGKKYLAAVLTLLKDVPHELMLSRSHSQLINLLDQRGQSCHRLDLTHSWTGSALRIYAEPFVRSVTTMGTEFRVVGGVMSLVYGQSTLEGSQNAVRFRTRNSASKARGHLVEYFGRINSPLYPVVKATYEAQDKAISDAFGVCIHDLM